MLFNKTCVLLLSVWVSTVISVQMTFVDNLKIENSVRQTETKATKSPPPKIENQVVENVNEPVVDIKEKREKLEIETSGKIEKGVYEAYRFYDSDVHVYVSGIGEKLAVSKGKEGLEKLSDMHMEHEVAKINLGMFDQAFEHGGMFLVNGDYQQPPMERYINVLYKKDGSIDIQKHGKEFAHSTLTNLQEVVNFVVGSTYSIVQDGKKNLENAEVFAHSDQRHPRSLFGQKKDGRYILAVIDGRNKNSRGVTATQSAEIMLNLGAVEAVNFDGGGSSTLIVDGEIRNTPSDKMQRRIGSALFVIH